MTGSTMMKLGGIAAIYLFWLVCWLVLGDEAFGLNFYNWDHALVAAAAAASAFQIGRRMVKPYPVFLIVKGIGLLMLTVSWVTYDPDGRHPSFHSPQQGWPDDSSISYALFVFAWVCAWGYLALALWQRKPPDALTRAVFAVLFLGLALILAGFYYPQYSQGLNTISGRLDAATSGLEFIVLIIGLTSILLGEAVVLNWILLATALLVASDMAYSEQDVPAGIEPVWMLGQFVLLSAFLILPDTLRRRQSQPVAAFSHRRARQRSGLSGILILLSLGGVLLSVAIGLLPIHPVWKSFCAVVFVVVLVVIQVWLTDRFDESVQYLKYQAMRLRKNRLVPEDWRSADLPVQATLQSTGLGDYLDSMNESAALLRQDVLFLGPERLYPAPRSSGGAGGIRSFLVMPFSQEWSDEVHRILSGACKAADVLPMRGDDVFTPTDILVDIWQNLNVSDFVIADITGRNPNVLYELGIAHTLAKPVLIISRNAEDIPIDLSTRRVIVYGKGNGDWRADLELKVSNSIREILNAYALAPAATATGMEVEHDFSCR